jgi:hypothetical protein
MKSDAVAIGSYAGNYIQNNGAVAIGYQAGQTSQGTYSLAVGYNAGNSTQGTQSVAIGSNSGLSNQGSSSVAVGYNAGRISQGDNAVSLGTEAGGYFQRPSSIAIGYQAGYTGQGTQSIAIGYQAGYTGQVSNAIAIGYRAGFSGQKQASIILNASSSPLGDNNTVGLFVNPVRQDATTTNALVYNPATYEITYNSAKTFVIDHPKKEGYYLVHACLEGPEAGVYYRGKGEIKENEKETIISLPDYVEKLATDFTVNITPINKFAKIVPTEVENNKFIVKGESCSFNWIVFGKRANISTEIDKSKYKAKGNGPYKWIDKA